MQITKRHWWAAGVGFVVAILAFFVWTHRASAPVTDTQGEPAASSTPDVTTGAPAEPAPATAFDVDPADTIGSWDFQGAYTNNATLATKATDEIARLNALLGKGEYSDYDLYVSIANQYDLLGSGQAEFTYLKKALALDSTQTGLAWYNAGQLFARLGAYNTARTALQNAAHAQPVPQYTNALADFNAAHPK